MKKRLIKKLAKCCECGNKVDFKGFYGVNGKLYWCKDCMNNDY